MDQKEAIRRVTVSEAKTPRNVAIVALVLVIGAATRISHCPVSSLPRKALVELRAAQIPIINGITPRVLNAVKPATVSRDLAGPKTAAIPASCEKDAESRSRSAK